MFIVCGVLYALDSATDRESKVTVAIDLYLSKPVEVSLQFTNPFRKTTQLGYDHMHKVRTIYYTDEQYNKSHVLNKIKIYPKPHKLSS